MERNELERAVGEADIPILLMVLMHLTGDRQWIEPPFRPVRDTQIFADEGGGLTEEICGGVRAGAVDVLSRDPEPIELSEALLAEMMGACVGEEVSAEYVPVLLEEMGLRPAPAARRAPGDPPRVLVVGAGLSGICAAVRLAEAGIPHLIVEKNADVGGTWLENRYPDAGVDTPNHFYSYSFTPHEDWGHYYSKQPEILDYIRRSADRHGVRDRVRFGTTVSASAWDPNAQAWRSTLVSAAGQRTELVTEAVITAVGVLNQPKIPPLAGLDTFEGPAFHTARWPDGLDLSGCRVAIIGTGASAVQAARTTAEAAAHLTIFQRSPQWIVPNPRYRAEVGDGKRALLREVPFYAAWYRFALFWRYADSLHPHIQVEDDWPHPERAVSRRNDKHRQFLAGYVATALDGRPDLVDKAMPSYPPYGKRMLLDNDWFATIRRDDVSLVTDAVTRIAPTAVECDDGRRHPADVLVLATGFHTTRFLWPMELIGRGRRSIHDVWSEDDPRAHLGITVPGFPNLFMLLGPNTGLGHGGSAIFHIEAQVRYVVECLTRMSELEIGALEPTREATDAYVARVDAAHERMVFAHPGMSNWYKNRAGRVVALSPWRLVDYWHMTREPDFGEFLAAPRAATAVR